MTNKWNSKCYNFINYTILSKNKTHLHAKFNIGYCFVSVFQGYTFMISSDYEREEWREIIREQQKKCKHSCSSQKPSHLPRKSQQDSVNCSIPSVTYWLNADIVDFTEWVSLGFYMFFSHRFQEFFFDFPGVADAHQLLREATNSSPCSSDNQ